MAEAFDINIPDNMKVRIAFFGAPCAGKSFRTTQLSENIKNDHIVGREFATDIIRKGQEHLLKNQIWVSTNQAERELNAFKNSNLLITDSPVDLGEIYSPPHQLDEVKKIIAETNKQYFSVNIFVKRDYTQPYHQEGRIHSDSQSREIEKNLLELFGNKHFISIERDTPLDDIVVKINKEIEREHILRKDFKPSQEQREPIDFFKNLEQAKNIYGDNFNISISALAGCGKTSTLRGIATQRKDLNFLYLVFSKKMQEESERKFGDNVHTVTINAFAYRNLGLNVEALKKYNPYDVASFLRVTPERADVVISELERFFHSNSTEMDNSYSTEVKDLWQKIYNDEFKYTHSAYLKVFFAKLEKDESFKAKIERSYDVILVDESQDLNKIAISITQKLNKPKIFVGDSNQNIFNFTAQNTNVFEIDGFFLKKFSLTETFRSSKNITNTANLILKFLKSPILLKSNVEQKKPQTTAYLSRTNSTILFKLYQMIKAQLPQDENGETIDLNSLSTDEYKEILSGIRLPKIVRDLKELFASVDTLSSLINYAEKGDEPHISDKKLEWLKDKIFDEQSKGRMMNGKEFIKFCASSQDTDIKTTLNLLLNQNSKEAIPLWKLKKMLQVIKQKRQFFKDQFIVTAHSSKGLEYDRVVLLDDFPNINGLYNKLNKLKEADRNEPEKIVKKNRELQDEIKLFYVAITRAKFEVEDRSGNIDFFKEQEAIRANLEQSLKSSESIHKKRLTEPSFSFDFENEKISI